MAKKICSGIVKGNIVLLKNGAKLPDGTEVLVTPVSKSSDSIEAVLAAVRRPPHLTAEDVAEWERRINEGQRPISSPRPRSKKRRG